MEIRQIVKAGLFLAFITASLYVLYWSPLRDYLHEVGKIKDTLERTGPWAPAVFVAVTAALVALGLPRLIICPIAGAVFGFVWGLLLSQAGTLLGCYAAFVFVRWGGRGFVLRHWPRLAALTGIFERRGYASVFLARQIPAGCVFINLLLGLMPVRHSAFLAGTLIGILPEAIPATLLGAGAIEMMENQGVWKAGVAIFSLMLVWLTVAEYIRRSGRASDLLARAKSLMARKGNEADEN